MSFANVVKLADKFAKKLEKLARDRLDELYLKLHRLVEALHPFVADNNLQEKGDYYEVSIEVMSTPDLSDEEFAKLVRFTANMMKNNLHAVDISFEDTTSTFANDSGQIVAVKGKVSK